jgi:hypothetical protein
MCVYVCENNYVDFYQTFVTREEVKVAPVIIGSECCDQNLTVRTKEMVLNQP